MEKRIGKLGWLGGLLLVCFHIGQVPCARAQTTVMQVPAMQVPAMPMPAMQMPAMPIAAVETAPMQTLAIQAPAIQLAGLQTAEDSQGSSQKEVAESEKSKDAQEPSDKSSESDKELESMKKSIKQLESDLKKIKDAETKKKEEAALVPSVKPRGRVHTDANWFNQSAANRAAAGDAQDGVYFRRARLGFDAKAFEITEYRLDWEMASGGGRPSIFDAYGRVTSIPWLGNIQLGHMREPFSLEAQTSSNWFTFIERGLNNTFDPSRNWGLMTFNHNEAETMTWAIGAFREGSDNFGDDIGDSGERAVTMRSTWLPYFNDENEGRQFFEVGYSYSYRDPDNRFASGPGSAETSIVRYQGRPQDNLNEDGVGSTPAFVETGNIGDASHVQLFGVESTMNLGSVNLQTEYIASKVYRVADSPFFHGAYAQASWFVTGESRRWDRKRGWWDRAEVNRPFRWRKSGKECGPGAWELAVRWNYLDLWDKSIEGGYMDATTCGLNWYLNPYFRTMFNCEFVDLHDPIFGRSDATVFHTRLDFHF